jgi:hypothetical protein
MATRKSTQAAPAASVNDSPKSLTPEQTPGDRACRYAMGVDTILRNFARLEEGDLAWGLHQLSEDASTVALGAIESGDIESIEAASCRYAMALAILGKIAHESHDDMLFAAEGLMESTKAMIDAEVIRLMRVESGAVQS